MIRVDCFWRDLLSQLEADRPWRSVIVLGSTDSGKSTLCKFLGEFFSKKDSTAIIDCDPGQSVLGPPATLSLSWKPRNPANPLVTRFIGSTTPSRNIPQTLTAMKRLADRAFEQGAQRIIFDSSGYAKTRVSREFFFQTIDLLEPDHLVALQEVDEMESLLMNFTHRAKPRIYRLPISEAVIRRSRLERRRYRENKFKQYFMKAAAQTLPLDGVGFHGEIPLLKNPDSWRNRLIALCDQRGFVVALGVIEAIDLTHNNMRVCAPSFEHGTIVSIQFGSIRLDHRSGQEILSR